MPTITANAVTYGTASGNQEISVSPVILPSATAGDITTSVVTLVVNENLTSTMGMIDLTGATTALTVDGATLDASSFTGIGAAIDLSGISSLTFTGTSTLNAGSGYVLLPAQSAITGTPTVMGSICYDSASVVTGDISSSQCYSGMITSSVGANALTISSELRSLESSIDLTGATLDASGFTGTGAAIDLSGTASLTFTGTNTLDAGTRDIALPSGFVISGTLPTITANAVTYGTASGNQEI